MLAKMPRTFTHESGRITDDGNLARSSLRRVDRLWQLEYQRIEDEADSATAYRAVRLTFLDLGLAVQQESTGRCLFVQKTKRPPRYLKEEWLEVRRLEKSKLSD